MQITIKAARVNAGLKQSEAAAKIGVNTATIINWEKGKTSPTSVQLQRLLDVYGISVDSIFLRDPATISENWSEGGSDKCT